ncbi:putative iron-regulated membrane protein [Allocatelliglobosispora scoriae]|uniref:Putative iron-regulated membrane protein n=1 Tax=Allocatelliglobosispora scoriae TaxID=643052 RepID=A0A841C3B8_9ACTN|nr:PepSY domain-containing protein [Allocatelliglobosispora scoriae]MBB5874385.1 putative iron-regulated membrane protein [Allocatelliglobosispora scoriae]
MSSTSAIPHQLAPPLPEPERQPSKRRASGLGALLLRLHFYAGILVAPFLIVAALTGLAYTVTPQLDAIVYGDQLYASQPDAAAKPIAEQIAAARSAHPEGALSSVTPGDGDLATRVVFSLPELGEKQHTVYVEPATAAVKGTVTTWFGSTPVTTFLDDLHRNLQLGDVGRYYSEIAASWLWVLVLGGVALWWRRQRDARNRARRLLLPDLAAKQGVRRTRSWHAATGLWLALGLLGLSATGLTWSRYAGANFSTALDALSAHRPELSTTLDGSQPDATGGHHGGADAATSTAPVDPAAADLVLKVARDNGLDGPVELALPASAGSAWTVTQVDNVWPVRKDGIAVDPGSGAVTARSDFADWPLLAQLSGLGVQAHMGILFGPSNQVLLALVAVGLLLMIFWGYRMWWQRRPTRTDRRATGWTSPVASGAWRRLPTWMIVVGIPVVIALGWFIPLFGIPLAGFLLIDVILGTVRANRIHRRRQAA